MLECCEPRESCGLCSHPLMATCRCAARRATPAVTEKRSIKVWMEQQLPKGTGSRQAEWRVPDVRVWVSCHAHGSPHVWPSCEIL